MEAVGAVRKHFLMLHFSRERRSFRQPTIPSVNRSRGPANYPRRLSNKNQRKGDKNGPMERVIFQKVEGQDDGKLAYAQRRPVPALLQLQRSHELTDLRDRREHLGADCSQVSQGLRLLGRG